MYRPRKTNITHMRVASMFLKGRAIGLTLNDPLLRRARRSVALMIDKMVASLERRQAPHKVERRRRYLFYKSIKVRKH